MSWRPRFPIGAEITPEGVHFRVWAPKRRAVEVLLERGAAIPLRAEAGGYFSGHARGVRAGARYRFRLDGKEAFPDPASRCQPEGPHGSSQVVDPASFEWSDAQWRGLERSGHVVYEMHVGTFTGEGTWAAAMEHLPDLAEIGISVIEMMPIHEFCGRFGWGYDGVDLYAPTRLYGEPDDLRRFIDRAHRLGLGVILDVVYNHLGPDGNYLPQYSDSYFTEKHKTDWGAAIDFDGEHSGPVREFFIANAGYWIEEYHFDGLRLDATQNIYDGSERHVLAELTAHARERAGARRIWIVAENEAQQARLARAPEQDGFGMDALWNDDFHHSAMVALTGRREAYYRDYRGSARELLAAIERGFLYQGQYYTWQRQARGTPALDLPREAFVTFLENHDQVANSSRGERCHQLTAPALHRAMTMLLLLAPGTPMLFQGQEFAASTPFLYFADHAPELAAAVRRGRAEFLAQFPSIASPESQAALDDPGDPATFARCKLDRGERERNSEARALVRDLLALRRSDPAFAPGTRAGIAGATLTRRALALRFFVPDGGDRLLIVNLGTEQHWGTTSEPLLAPPAGASWQVRLSSEDLRYRGNGRREVRIERGWTLPAQSAILLAAVAKEPSP